MDPRSLQYLAAAAQGELSSGEPGQLARAVCTDSRQARPGDLFVALKGERHDAHAFLPDVMSKVSAVLVERSAAPARLAAGAAGVIVVEDTRVALGRLAAAYRRDFTLPIIAIAGSNGKTTTKELLAAILRQRLRVIWSEASFNNDIGVPLTLLRIGAEHEAAVVEVGTNHPGELAPLARNVQPRYGVITSIGREHLEFFSDLRGVAKEEGELAGVLPPEGRLFIHGDSEFAGEIAARSRAPVVRAGFNEGNDWRITAARVDHRGTAFTVRGPRSGLNGEYRLQLLGRHQAVNATLALAAAAELGMNEAEIRAGLAECRPPKMRMEIWECNGARVLDDAYNANADSMRAALETLGELPCRGRRMAVLGEMAELGAHSEAAHEEVGRRAAELGVGQLFAVGPMAPVLARGARAGGLARVLEFADAEPAAAAVRQFVRSGDLVLLKASRAARLERVAELLRAERGESE